MPASTLDAAIGLHQQRRFAEAETHLRQWLETHPGDAEGWLRLGNTLLELRQGDRALAAYQRHLTILPTSALGHTAMGNLLLAAERLDQAIAFHRRAVTLKPDHTEGWHYLAIALGRDGQIDEAVDAFRRAIELRSNFSEARRHLATSLLLRGDLTEGWVERAALNPLSEPLWSGAPMPRATLLVRAGMDIGEMLLFARFLESTRGRVGRLIVECPPALIGLFERTAGVDHALATGTPLPSFDLSASLADLPRILQTRIAEIGQPKSYLSADPKRVTALRARIAAIAKDRLKIGLTDLPFEFSAPNRSGVAYIALSSAATTKHAIDLGIATGDLEELAAAVVDLDFVIGGDGPILRLASGLGIPVWVLLPSVPDWPWMLGLPDSPWYPTACLFRQAKRGDWKDTAQELTEALTERVDAISKRPPPANRIAAARTLHQQGRMAEAAALYRRGLDSQPDNPDLLHLLGLACHQMGQSSIGVALIKRAVSLMPKFPEAWNNLGIALRTLGRTPEAIASFEKAVNIRPRFDDAHYNLGNARMAHRDLRGAEAAYRKAIRIAPHHSGAHYNLGNLLRDQHRLREAIASYRKAIAHSPDNAEIRQSLALCLLLDGQYAEGFTDLEWRWRTTGITRREFTQPAWDGRPFAGQRLYIYAEQGLGDTLQFIRYIPQVKAMGGEVIVEAQRALLPLLARIPGIDGLVPVGDPPPSFDLQAPLMSLPRLLKTRLDSIPARVPYLTGDPERSRRWRTRLDAAAQGALKIGLVWAGSPAFRADRLRSPRLKACLPLFDIPFVHIFGLQVGDGRRDLEGQTMPSHFTDLGGEIADFEDTAAIVGELDVMISSCTAPVHLAGALGVPTWVILPYVPDWRWMLERSDSPWYPTVRLFRQTEPENWSPVVAEVASALRIRSEKSAINLNNQANRLKESGRVEESLPLYQQAMAAAPSLPQIPYNHSIALEVLGRVSDAEAALRQALALDPDHRSSLINLGALLLRNGRAAEALTWFEKASALGPDDPQVFYNLASTLQVLGRNDEALVAYNRTLSLRPDMPLTLNNMGACLRQLGRHDEAVETLNRAAKANPDLPEVHNNLGLVLKDLGQIAESIACHRKAVSLNPDHADAHWNLGLALLLSGDFEAGWQEYEWRWQSRKTTTTPRAWPMPLWKGEPLAGRCLIVHCEQGFGDSMQFVRYLPLLTERGARVILEAPTPLLRLFHKLDGAAQVITPDEPTPKADFHVPLLSLPLRFATRLNSIPAPVPYLHAAPDAIAAWKQRLAGLSGLRIGLVWAGDPRHTDDYKRSMPLDVLAPLIKMPGTAWVSLQKGAAVSQIAASGLPLDDLGSELTDFADTAALLKALDLVISVDTSVVHAAGAMGITVWVLLPFVPEFRWMIGRDDSPWYPSARLFRQPRIGAWDKVVEQLAQALSHRLLTQK